MDNLLIKTVKFFFVPEAALAVFFLVVFAVIFGLGIYWERNCRKNIEYLRDNAERDYNAVRAKISPELFIKKYLNKLSPTENKIEGIPEEFVSIGIVATFLGLGVAIQGSAELLENEKLELAKLTAVLGVIAFKFQTSVWGICFSLIFRRAVVESYFDFRQETVDYVTELLYLNERASIRTLLEKQNDFLEEQAARREELELERHKNLLTENRQLFTVLFEKLAAAHSENLQAISLQNAQIVQLEKNLHADNLKNLSHLEYMADNLKTFVAAAEKFTETAAAFSNNVEQFKIELLQNLQAGFADIKTSNENLENLHEKHIEEIHSQHERNIFYVTEKLDELHQKFYLDSIRYVEETQNALQKILEETVDKINDGYIREAAEIRNTIDKLNETLATVEARVNFTNEEFIAKQNQFVNEWRTVTSAVTDTLKIFESTVAENFSTAAKSYKDFQTFNANNAQNLTNITEQAVNNFNKISNKFTDSLENNLAALQKNSNSNAQNLANITEQAANNFNKTANKFIRALESNLATLATLQNDNAANFNSLNSELAQIFSDALKNFTLAQDSYTKNISAISEKLEQILVQQKNLVEKLNPPSETSKSDKVNIKSVSEGILSTLRNIGGKER